MIHFGNLVIFTIISRYFADSGNIFNITRILNSGDVFWYHMENDNCDPKSCSKYSALSLRYSPCHCQCPNGNPVFLQHIQQCTNIIDFCRLISFVDLHKLDGYPISIPTTFLPLTGEVLNPNLVPNWKELNVGNNSNGLVPCNVSGMAYLTNTGWVESQILFSLINVNGNTYLQWLGTMLDQIELTGKLVQVAVQCETDANFCFAFRIIGKDIMPFGAFAKQINRKKHSSNQTDQFGLIIGIICGIFLTATLLGVAIFWLFCWRQKKRRTPTRDNLRTIDREKFSDEADNYSNYYVHNQPSIYHHSNEDYVAQRCLQQRNNIPYSSESNWSRNENRFFYNDDYRFNAHNYYIGNEQYLNPMILSTNYYDEAVTCRKNLPHFTSEFFRPECMIDPPEAAEHFLQDVRQRIGQIRSKNRTRKYTPNLPEICEERESELESPCSESRIPNGAKLCSNDDSSTSTKLTSTESESPCGASGDSSESFATESFMQSNDSGIESDKKEVQDWLSRLDDDARDDVSEYVYGVTLHELQRDTINDQSTLDVIHI